MFKRMGEFIIDGRALGEDGDPGSVEVPLGITEKDVKWRKGARGENLRAERRHRLNAVRNDRHPKIERSRGCHQERGLALIALDQRHR